MIFPRTFFLLGSLLLLFVRVQGQTAVEKAPAPSGTLLQQPGDFSSWQISYSYGDVFENTKREPRLAPEAGASYIPLSLPRTVTLTRTNPLFHSRTVDVDGKVFDQWFDGGEAFFYIEGAPPALADKFDWTLTPNYSKNAFPDFGFVSSNSFIGIQSVEGTRCFVFQKDGMTAWISTDTRYPCKWEKANEVRVFKQLAAPTQKLALPDAVKKLSDGIKRDKAWIKAPIPRGG